MRQKSVQPEPSSERIVKDIRRATRKQYSAEEKIRIVLDGLRGEHQHRGAMPSRGDRREPVLQLVEGVPGSRQATAGRAIRHARRPAARSRTCGGKPRN